MHAPHAGVVPTAQWVPGQQDGLGGCWGFAWECPGAMGWTHPRGAPGWEGAALSHRTLVSPLPWVQVTQGGVEKERGFPPHLTDEVPAN